MPGLLSPWFLLGLGALAVPILVHLIHRERKEVQGFPSLMFLQRIPYQAVRRQKIRHWLLFLMRCLAMLLVVGLILLVAFAPALWSRAGAVAPAQPRDVLAGRQLYVTHCVACHGEGGRGDGPSGAGLASKPADLTDGRLMNTLPDDFLVNIILRGGPAEGLSPGQAGEIDRVARAYPHLTDEGFVRGHVEGWLRD